MQNDPLPPSPRRRPVPLLLAALGLLLSLLLAAMATGAAPPELFSQAGLALALALSGSLLWLALAAERPPADRTAEIEARQAARLAHARLADAIESLPAGFMLFDRTERLVIANSWLRQVVHDAATLLRPGTPLVAIVDDIAAHLPGELTAAERRQWAIDKLAEVRRGDLDREQTWGDGRCFQLLDRHTSEGGLVCIRLDITARRRAEEQLRQAQKMQVLGQLTGGVAHDFNNLLMVVMGSLEAIGAASADPRIAQPAAMALRAVERGATLTRRLLSFARRQSLTPEVLDLNQLIGGMAEMLRRTLGSTIALELHAGERLWPTLVDAGEVQTAILNLVLNARDAMPQGGRLTLATANAQLDRGDAADHAEVTPGDYVLVTVRDTGVGMTDAVLERAFEPFFTTKGPDRGTGLGLSAVYGFVRQSGGHATIDSEPGRGTIVSLYLPRAAAAAAEPRADDNPAAETVLVVDDQAPVRETVAALMTALGYRVLMAADGPSALALVAERDDIDLLFSDVTMPGGLSGPALAGEARRLRPGLRVLLTSGYAAAGNPDRSHDLIAKPYRKTDLARRLRAVLDRAA